MINDVIANNLPYLITPQHLNQVDHLEAPR